MSTEERLDKIEEALAQLSQSMNFLVTEFIRPSAQQARSNYERLERLEIALETLVAQTTVNAEHVDANQQQIAANSEQVGALGDRIEQFDGRLEDTRGIVAQNGSMIAQLGTKLDQLAEKQDQMIEENRAFRESQQTQLAAILSNARRIDRLEQQAS